MCLTALGGEFQTEGASSRGVFKKRRKKKKRRTKSKCLGGMRRVLESEVKRSCLDGVYNTHGEDQTDKQGLYWRKGSDKELITYVQHVLR